MGWLDKLLGRDKEQAPSLDDADVGVTSAADDTAGDAEDAAEDVSYGEEPSAGEAGEHDRSEL